LLCTFASVRMRVLGASDVLNSARSSFAIAMQRKSDLHTCGNAIVATSEVPASNLHYLNMFVDVPYTI
jgi:hypothetical protein